MKSVSHMHRTILLSTVYKIYLISFSSLLLICFCHFDHLNNCPHLILFLFQNDTLQLTNFVSFAYACALMLCVCSFFLYAYACACTFAYAYAYAYANASPNIDKLLITRNIRTRLLQFSPTSPCQVTPLVQLELLPTRNTGNCKARYKPISQIKERIFHLQASTDAMNCNMHIYIHQQQNCHYILQYRSCCKYYSFIYLIMLMVMFMLVLVFVLVPMFIMLNPSKNQPLAVQLKQEALRA